MIEQERSERSNLEIRNSKLISFSFLGAGIVLSILAGFYFGVLGPKDLPDLLRIYDQPLQILPTLIEATVMFSLSAFFYPFSTLGKKSLAKSAAMLPTRKSEFAEFLILVAAAFLTASTILSNYAVNCSQSCYLFDFLSSPFWGYYYFHFYTLFRSLSGLPDGDQFFIQSVLWFSLLLASFLSLRLSRTERAGTAIIDSVQLGLAILLLFEVGTYFICPNWRAVRVTNIQKDTVLSWFTNNDLLLTAGGALCIIICARSLWRIYSKPRASEKRSAFREARKCSQE